MVLDDTIPVPDEGGGVGPIANKIVDPKGGEHDLTDSGMTTAVDEAAANDGGVIWVGAGENAHIVDAAAPYDVPPKTTFKGPSRGRVTQFRRTGDYPVWDFATRGAYYSAVVDMSTYTAGGFTPTTPVVRDDAASGTSYGNAYVRSYFNAESDGTGTHSTMVLTSGYAFVTPGTIIAGNAQEGIDVGSSGTKIGGVRFEGPSRAITVNSADFVQYLWNNDNTTSSSVYMNTGGKRLFVYSDLQNPIGGGTDGTGNQYPNTRAVINGHSYNDGDPNNGGTWNGNAALARRLGVVVYDNSSTGAQPMYRGDGNSGWTRVA